MEYYNLMHDVEKRIQREKAISPCEGYPVALEGRPGRSYRPMSRPRVQPIPQLRPFAWIPFDVLRLLQVLSVHLVAAKVLA
jgi:hypothetical protein